MMMLLAPFMDVIRVLKEKFLEMRAERAREENSRSPEGMVVEKIMSSDADIEASLPKIEAGLPKLTEPEIKEVEVMESEIQDEVKEMEKKVEMDQVERKEVKIKDDTSKE